MDAWIDLLGVFNVNSFQKLVKLLTKRDLPEKYHSGTWLIVFFINILTLSYSVDENKTYRPLLVSLKINILKNKLEEE